MHHRHLRAPEPKHTLYLQVGVSHPRMGDFFHASLEARRSTVNARSEAAGLATLLRLALTEMCMDACISVYDAQVWLHAAPRGALDLL